MKLPPDCKYPFGAKLCFSGQETFFVKFIQWHNSGTYMYSEDGDNFYSEEFVEPAKEKCKEFYAYRVRGTEEIVHSKKNDLEETSEMFIRTTGCDLE